MRDKRGVLLLAFFLLSLFIYLPAGLSEREIVFVKSAGFELQDSPIKKPTYDYMSTFLNRNTNPLGLKIDLALQKLLKQSNTKWAYRARERYILE